VSTRTSQRFPQVIDIIPVFFVSPVKNDAALREKYLDQGFSAAQIARELGVARSTVAERLNRLGIARPPTRPGYLLAQTPFGWRASRGQLVTNSLEQKLLLQMRDWREKGLSLHKIAARLNVSGARTKNGGTWQAKTVSRILPADTACGQGGPLLKLLWEPKQLQALTVCLVCRKDTLASSLARVVRGSIQQALKGVVPGRKYKKTSFATSAKAVKPLMRGSQTFPRDNNEFK